MSTVQSYSYCIMMQVKFHLKRDNANMAEYTVGYPLPNQFDPDDGSYCAPDYTR